MNRFRKPDRSRPSVLTTIRRPRVSTVLIFVAIGLAWLAVAFAPAPFNGVSLAALAVALLAGAVRMNEGKRDDDDR